MAAPVNTVAPTISGSPAAGSTLSVALGTWKNANSQWEDIIARDFVRPSFSPSRTVTCTSVSSFNTAMSNLQVGDLVNVNGVAFTGETRISKSLSDYAEIHFNSGCTFRNAGSGNPSVYVTGCSHLRIYGGDISSGSTGNQCLFGIDNDYVSWWDFVLHDGGGTGLVWNGSTKTSTHCSLKGEIYNCGLDTSAYDPHAEPGTGIHASNLGDRIYTVSNATFALYVHDQPSGAAIEISQMNTINVYLKANNLTKAAQSQVAGNGLQPWDGGETSQKIDYMTVKYIEVQNAQGRAIDPNDVDLSGGLANSVVQIGRAYNCLLNPKVTGAVYSTKGGLVLQDCQVLDSPIYHVDYTYQWLRDGNAISGATNPTYLVSGADAGHQISARVIGTNSDGVSSPVTSAAVTVAGSGGTTFITKSGGLKEHFIARATKSVINNSGTQITKVGGLSIELIVGGVHGVTGIPDDKANNSPTKDDHPGHHNVLATEINKIEALLGIQPAITFGTVAARLTAQNKRVVKFIWLGSLVVASGNGRFTFPFNATLLSASAAAGTAPTGNSVIVDILKNGSTVFTTQTKRPTIPASANVSGVSIPDITQVAAGDYITVNIAQVGSTVNGSDLSVVLAYAVS